MIIVALGRTGGLLHKQPEPDTLLPSLIQPTALQELYYSLLQGGGRAAAISFLLLGLDTM